MGHKVKIFTTKLDEEICFQEYLSLPVEVVGARACKTLKQAFGQSRDNLLFGIAKSFNYNLMHTYIVLPAFSTKPKFPTLLQRRAYQCMQSTVHNVPEERIAKKGRNDGYVMLQENHR